MDKRIEVYTDPYRESAFYIYTKFITPNLYAHQNISGQIVHNAFRAEGFAPKYNTVRERKRLSIEEMPNAIKDFITNKYPGYYICGGEKLTPLEKAVRFDYSEYRIT